MLSHKAICGILGINPEIDLKPEAMASKLTVTVFPYDHSVQSEQTRNFLNILLTSLKELGVNVVPYEKTLQNVPLFKIVIRFSKIVINNCSYVILKGLNIESRTFYIHWGAILNLLKMRRIMK